VAPKDSNNYYLNFIAGNPQKPGGFGDSGCAYTDGTYGWPTWVKPDGTTIYPPPLLNECYTHDSLVTAAADCGTGNYCDRGLVSWAYYTPTRGIIWDAPEGIPEVCYQENNLNDIGKACGTVNGGQEWSSHVYLPDVNGYSDAPIFDDLYKCKLKQISWVVPDVAWSDHPQDKWKTNLGNVYGASYVGDIIDAVGGGMANSTCNGLGSGKYWTTEPTLVIVVWDHWGGWFDHVAPYIARQENPNQGYTQCDPSSQWGCGYTSGFRVPLMVVSPYTGTKNADGSYSGYVSGACGASPLPPCPNKTFPYVHDFGSILAFTEYNFNLSQIYPDTNYYADYNAPDWGTERGNIHLSDFFPLSTAQPRPFVSISTSKPFTYFQTYYQTTGASPTGPDDDDEADQ
jgi:hypothetical protein